MILPSLPTTRLRRVQFAGHALVQFDDFVEGVGHLAGHAGPFHRQADGEIAFLEGVHGLQQHGGVDAAVAAPLETIS